MVLSVTEKSYLYDSLSLNPPIRPDGRLPYQFRPIEISTNFLPNSNGSSKILTSDSDECIVSIKSKVIDHTIEDELLLVDVNLSGYRDDSPLVVDISSILNKLLKEKLNLTKLQVTKKYSFKLFIDVLVLSCNSNPISLISFAIYCALNCTFLPKLISNDDDLEIEELPTFHDFDLVKLEFDPPILFIVGIIGSNMFVDPSCNECDVANNGLLITWSRSKITSPIRSIILNDTFIKSFDVEYIQKAISLIEKCAPSVIKALDCL